MQLAFSRCRPVSICLRQPTGRRSSLGTPQRTCRCPCWASFGDSDGHNKKEKGRQGVRAAASEHVEKQLDKLLAFLMPRERGDVRDVALMSTSIVLLVWAAAMLYRVYAWSYAAAGLRPVMSHFVK